MTTGANEFGVKDMLIILNGKVDEVLEKMSDKADKMEVDKLRERMHKVEGGQAVLTSLIDTIGEIRTLYKEMHTRVSVVERDLMTEKAVEEAILERSQRMQSTIWKAAGLLGTVVTADIVVTLSNGGGP